MSSTASSLRKWDVFLSFRGLDTRRHFISFLYKELYERNIQTFKDDKELEYGQQIFPELKHAIEVSKFAVVVVSVNYAASSWCLDELVSIMDLADKKSITVVPVFYGVDPSQVRWQHGKVGEQFKKHEGRYNPYRVLSWRQALTKLANISGSCSFQSKDDTDLVDKIVGRISRTLDKTRSIGSNLEGIDKHMKTLNLLMELNSDRNVKIVGIWAIGCEGRSALAKFVYQKMNQEFERHCFLGSVSMISQGRRHVSHLKEELQRRIQGKHSSKLNLKCQKVLLVADDVNTHKQLDALASVYNGFGPGSVVIITSHDKQLLLSSSIEYVQNVGEAAFKQTDKVADSFPQTAFKQEDISAAFESYYLGCRRDISAAYSHGILS